MYDLLLNMVLDNMDFLIIFLSRSKRNPKSNGCQLCLQKKFISKIFKSTLFTLVNMNQHAKKGIVI